jgi:hypothetical protein
LGKFTELVQSFLDAHLSSSEEKLFGDFLEKLAVFVVEKTYGGGKSAATGIDLEFVDRGIRYLVSVKSGPNWGNSSQYKRLATDFDNAVRVLKQNDSRAKIQPVLGICYGKVKTGHKHGFMKMVGQNFWFLISRDKDLYTKIIEPLGHEARKHNEDFLKKKGALINQFTHSFLNRFCPNGLIDWVKLVQFNSGNLDIR